MHNLHLSRCSTWSAFLSQLYSYLRARLEDNLCPAIVSSRFEPRLCLFLSLPYLELYHLTCVNYGGGQPWFAGLWTRSG